MYKNRFTALLLPLSLAVAAHASDDVYTLDDVVVTATRTKQTVDQTLAPVTVITRQDIDESQATSVPELLNTVPGVQINTSGGPGSIASLFIRGTSSDQSLVLIDGQRIGSATMGYTSLQYFDPNQIERVEIVRGPKASLYGADAIGGVINIITRSGHGTPKANLSAGYGSQNTRTASANIAGSHEGTSYYFGASRFMTDGYDSTINSTENNDDDFYHNTSANIKVTHQVNNDLTAGISLYQSEGVSEYDDKYNPNDDPRYAFKEQLASALLSYNFSRLWTSDLNLSYTKDSSEALKTQNPNTYKTTRHLVSWQNNISISDGTLLTAGLDYYKDKVDSSVSYDETSRDNEAIFLQSQTGFKQSDLNLSLRRDNNQRYGNKTTGSIAWGINLPADMRLIASYGTAFKAPTFNDLYYPGSGNPNLQPENSNNKEIEWRGYYPMGSWGVSAFQNDIEDMISWVDYINPTNIDKARIRGLEIEATAKLQEWNFTTSITFLDPKDTQKDKDLIRRARQMLAVDAERQLGTFFVGGTIKARSHSFDDADNKNKVSGFATADLRISWQMTKDFKAGLKLVNLLDKKYETTKGYREEPRSAFATLTWSPEI